jgi:hypothetical protein
MAFGKFRASTAPAEAQPSRFRSDAGWGADDWLQPLPAPEVQEGGESMWDAWNEESARMDLAFADTQPSDMAPLADASTARPVVEHRIGVSWTADEVKAIARRHNRVCPRQFLWSALYQLLEGERYADLRPPPRQAWVWATMSNMQRRQYFAEYLDWADRHGKLEQLGRYIDALAEPDWIHLGEN